MPALSEDEIKSAFLPYLREFYRFRYEYQQQTEKASLDNITTDGYIADGMLSFEKPDGTPFVCTYEATSQDKIEEVKFSLNQSYFIWDCIAFGAFSAAMVYGFFYIVNHELIANLSPAGKWGMPIGIGFIAFFIWYFLMRNWKKYRYIYAIEQFKQYYADEQWVAIAEDVFPAITSPYFLELKDQCVYHGVGLAIVYSDRQVRTMAAPSRLGVFGESRKMAHWITDLRFYQSMTSNIRVATQLQNAESSPFYKLRRTIARPILRFFWNPLMRALGSTAQPATDIYKRFTGSYLVQKWVTSLAIIIIVAVSYSAKKHQDVVDVDHQPEIFQIPKPEPVSPEHDDRYVRNEGENPIPYGAVHSSENPSGIPRQEGITGRNITSNSNNYSSAAQQNRNIAPALKPTPKAAPIKKKPMTPANKTTTSLCEQVRKAGGWYIQENRFSSSERAELRVAELKKEKIQCDYFSGGCFGQPGWIVRLGTNQKNEKAAQEKAIEFGKQLSKAKLKNGIPLVKKITQ